MLAHHLWQSDNFQHSKQTLSEFSYSSELLCKANMMPSSVVCFDACLLPTVISPLTLATADITYKHEYRPRILQRHQPGHSKRKHAPWDKSAAKGTSLSLQVRPLRRRKRQESKPYWLPPTTHSMMLRRRTRQSPWQTATIPEDSSRILSRHKKLQSQRIWLPPMTPQMILRERARQSPQQTATRSKEVLRILARLQKIEACLPHHVQKTSTPTTRSQI